MRAPVGLSWALLLLVLWVATGEAGVVTRRVRDTPIATELRKDQIPVTIVEYQEPNAVQSEQRVEPAVVVAELEPQLQPLPIAVALKEIAPPSSEIAENIVQAVELDQQLNAIGAVVEAERRIDGQLIGQQAASQPDGATPVHVVVVKDELAPAEILPNLKVLPVAQETLSVDVPAADDAAQPSSDDGAVAVDPVAAVRQATQATPTQTSTQQNFVQQFIQNTPIGQFFNQLTGAQQAQPAQGQPPAGVAADQPATPAPTVPGFLNPTGAFTSAQQAVQSVVNSTSQAFQGFQQFASNLGSQFQNTLSSLTGQQQATEDATTTRRPGPLQSFVSTFVGGNGNQASPTSAPGQQQGPLQGIISFFQGNNQATAVTAAAPAKEPEKKPELPEKQPELPAPVDDKIDGQKQDEIVEQSISEADEAIATNEVRNSGEQIVEEDSFEEAHPEDLIIVNDDANEGGEVAA